MMQLAMVERLIDYYLKYCVGKPTIHLVEPTKPTEEEVEFVPEDEDDDIEFIPWHEELEEEDYDDEYEDDYPS